MPHTIPVEDMGHMGAEIARGVAKADSLWANKCPEYSEWWDQDVKSQDFLVKNGTTPDIVHDFT